MCPTLTVGSYFFTRVRSTFCSFVQQLELMKVQNTRTPEARPKRKEETKDVQNLENTLRIHLSPTFFRYYATFFEFFLFQQRHPLQFLTFSQLPILAKNPKESPFYFFRYCDPLQKSQFLNSFFKKFPKFF